MAPRRRGTFVFSPFRFFPESGELHEGNRGTRCPAQAAAVLHTLLLHAGEVVTREQMRAALWPEDDVFASDDAINKCISYLRQTLGDSSRTPRYIETLPKRGYRFVAPVEIASSSEQVELAADVETAAKNSTPSAVDLPAPTQESQPVKIELAAVAPTRRRLSRPFAAVVILLTVLPVIVWLGWWFGKARHTPPPTYLRVGIAPFEVTGAGSSELAESFRLDIIDALAQVPKLRVSASHLTPAGSEGRRAMLGLQADVLIFGTMTFDRDRAQLQLELARGNDATHIASFRYEVALKNLIGLREQVQADLLPALDVSHFRRDIALGSTANAEAYAIFLEAHAHLQRWDPASWVQAEKEFRQAMALDPDFARAYSGLASTLITIAEHGTAAEQKAYEEARRQTTHALELDPQLAEGHAVLGSIIYHYDWNFPRAEQEYRRAIESDPGNAGYHVWLAGLLCNLGRFSESLVEVRLAHSLDPSWKSPYLAAAFIYHSSGQSQRSLEVLRQLLAMQPDYSTAHHQLGWIDWYDGKYAQAVAEWHTMAVLDGDKDRAALEEEGGRILAEQGPVGYANLRLRAIESGKAWHRQALDFVPSEWFIFAGQRDNAIAALSSQVDRHDPAALQIAVDPAYVPLHDDPRYRMLLNRMHLSLPVQPKRENGTDVWN